MSSAAPPGWRPLLDGALADQAASAALAVADALTDMPNGSLAAGDCGAALLFAYLERAGLGDGLGDRAAERVDRAIAAVGDRPLDASLYNGVAGVAWTVEHLFGEAPDEPDGENDHEPDEPDDSDDPVADVDAVLLDVLAQSPWPGEHDVVSGLAGMAVYALERLPRAAARRSLQLILDRLEESAAWTGPQATWKTRPELLVDASRRLYPDGYYNVGVAHGVPGLLVVLAAIEAAGIGGGRAARLVAGARAWVLGQALETGAFPYLVGPGIQVRQARFAWCYGDPGVAGALLAAGQTADALSVARRAATEPTSRDDVRDAGLCHGAAGLAHIFNRVFQATRDSPCADAARRWYARALELREPAGGVAGFRSWRPVVDGEGGWESEPGLLTGAAGVALALVAAIAPVEPAWDRVFLLSARR